MFPHLHKFEMAQYHDVEERFKSNDMYPDCGTSLSFLFSHTDLKDMFICCVVRGQDDVIVGQATQGSSSTGTILLLNSTSFVGP